MKYKKLHNFKDIINRTDFDYISDIYNIKRIEEVIEINILNPSTNDNICIQVLRDFNSNLESFVNSIGCVGLLKMGYEETKTELERVINIISQETPDNRKKIGRHTIHQFKKRFLKGLSVLYKGLNKAFDILNIGDFNFTEDQLINFICNKKVGLSENFQFNTIGKHSAYRKVVNSLNKNELVVVIRLLTNPGNQKRTFNNWTDLGERGTLVRILKYLNNVYYIFRISEHNNYEAYLQIPPEKSRFRSA